MLCRRCDGGCFAAHISLGPADTLPPFLLSGGCFAAVFALLIGRLWRLIRHCGAAYFGGCLATHWLCSWSVGGLGDVVLLVGSSVLVCFVGLGGLVRPSALWSFVGLFSIFSLLLLLCVLVPVNYCLASIKLCL